MEVPFRVSGNQLAPPPTGGLTSLRGSRTPCRLDGHVFATVMEWILFIILLLVPSYSLLRIKI
jgi:hypothetical protein